MNIRKFLLAIFIVISLGFSYQPVNIFAKERESIVFIIDARSDNFTNEFIKRNETRKQIILVSLTLKLLINNSEKVYFNTS